MPTYTYRCDHCGHKFEIVQRMSEDALKDCPDCQAATLVKQIQPVGFALKGSGWYVTDFRDKGKAVKTEGEPVKPDTAAESKGEAKTDAKADTKVETKTETKTEAKTETKTEAKPAASSTPD